MVRAVLFDLDGVLRRWPPGDPVVLEAAFERTLLHRAVTGAIDDATWRAAVAERVGWERVAVWSAGWGSVDAEVLDVVRAVRRRMPVGLLTNATTRLRDDLARLGLDREVDVVVSSAEVGVAKPDEAVYWAACEALGLAPEEVLFVDDTPAHVAGARDAGLEAVRFVGAAELRTALGL